MKLKTAIIILEYHNTWRRGAEVKMVNPKQLGEAIDIITGYSQNPTPMTYSIQTLDTQINAIQTSLDLINKKHKPIRFKTLTEQKNELEMAVEILKEME